MSFIVSKSARVVFFLLEAVLWIFVLKIAEAAWKQIRTVPARLHSVKA